MASKLFIFLAMICFLISGFMPVHENANGMQYIFVMFVMLLYSFIYPGAILCIFPIAGCVLFLFALNEYFDKRSYLDARKSVVIAVILIAVFLIFALINGHLKLGIVFWFSSSLFLLCGIFVDNINKKYANIIFVLVISLFIFLGYSLYYFEIYNSQYQDVEYKNNIWKADILRKKDSDLKIPDLTQVKQNNIKRYENNIKLDENGSDLEFLKDDLIELNFGKTIHIPLKQKEIKKCELKGNEQLPVIKPPVYLENKYIWYNYMNFSIGKPTIRNSNYIFRATNIDERHTKLEIQSKANNKIIYEQILVSYPWKNSLNEGCKYGPAGYLDELLAAFKFSYQLDRFSSDAKLAMGGEFKNNEHLSEKCSWDTLSKSLYSFENKKIKFTDEKIINPKILCSKNYVAVLYFEYDLSEKIDDFLRLKVFHRADLEPIYCGSVLFPFEKSQIKKLFNEELAVQSVKILNTKKGQKCPDIQVKLSDGYVIEKNNFL